MALNMNAVGNYNGKSFLGTHSQRPICGVFLRDLYKGALSQAKVGTGLKVYPGVPVQIKNQTNTTRSPKSGLNPNVLLITALSAQGGAGISGFVLESPTDVLQFGEIAASALEGQVVNVALIGSGVELYLPCKDDVLNVEVEKKLVWDFAEQALGTGADGIVTPLGPVVDGIKYVNTGGSIGYAETKCIRVRL